MASPNQEAIDTFIGITGLPETTAVQFLQEHGGDLTRAVNAHFNEGDRAFARGTAAVATEDDFMDVDEPVQIDPHESSINLNLPPVNNPGFDGRVLDSASEFRNHAPFVLQPSGRRFMPIEVNDENDLPSQSDIPSTAEDVTRGPRVREHADDETIVIDDEDDATENFPSARNAWDTRRAEPSAPILPSIQEPDVDIEEEMIRAAIEASKREAEGVYSSEQLGVHNVSDVSQSQFHDSDAQFGPSSFAGVGQENLLREHVDQVNAETILPEDDSSTGVGRDVIAPPSSPGEQQLRSTIIPQIQQNNDGFPADEWGGISSAEHDEAVMLEAAMFGGIPETSEYNAFAARRIMQPNLNGNFGAYMRPEPRPPSPNLTAQRIIREQQDDEYLASLQADIEKAEARRLEEQAARDAALEEQKRKEEESLRKLEEEQELERQLAAKEASIPQEPSPDDASAVNLLVRMPDGSRRGRRFLKSDKLRSLFDYIDIGRVVKPGTYRLVRPYPRRAFGDGDTILTLNELGLTSKQEALYLELA
ncbi:unnamed protein product [Rhodiola kirilowii]